MTADVAAIRAEQGRRFGEWLRTAYPQHTAKRAARALGVAMPTVEKLLAGERPPSGDLLAKAAAVFGWRFVALVMEPAAGPQPTPAAMLAEVQRARADLAAMDARLAKLLEAAR